MDLNELSQMTLKKAIASLEKDTYKVLLNSTSTDLDKQLAVAKLIVIDVVNAICNKRKRY